MNFPYFPYKIICYLLKKRYRTSYWIIKKWSTKVSKRTKSPIIRSYFSKNKKKVKRIKKYGDIFLQKMSFMPRLKKFQKKKKIFKRVAPNLLAFAIQYFTSKRKDLRRYKDVRALKRISVAYLTKQSIKWKTLLSKKKLFKKINKKMRKNNVYRNLRPLLKLLKVLLPLFYKFKVKSLERKLQTFQKRLKNLRLFYFLQKKPNFSNMQKAWLLYLLKKKIFLQPKKFRKKKIWQLKARKKKIWKKLWYIKLRIKLRIKRNLNRRLRRKKIYRRKFRHNKFSILKVYYKNVYRKRINRKITRINEKIYVFKKKCREKIFKYKKFFKNWKMCTNPFLNYFFENQKEITLKRYKQGKKDSKTLRNINRFKKIHSLFFFTFNSKSIFLRKKKFLIYHLFHLYVKKKLKKQFFFKKKDISKKNSNKLKKKLKKLLFRNKKKKVLNFYQKYSHRMNKRFDYRPFSHKKKFKHKKKFFFWKKFNRKGFTVSLYNKGFKAFFLRVLKRKFSNVIFNKFQKNTSLHTDIKFLKNFLKIHGISKTLQFFTKNFQFQTPVVYKPTLTFYREYKKLRALRIKYKNILNYLYFKKFERFIKQFKKWKFATTSVGSTFFYKKNYKIYFIQIPKSYNSSIENCKFLGADANSALGFKIY